MSFLKIIKDSKINLNKQVIFIIIYDFFVKNLKSSIFLPTVTLASANRKQERFLYEQQICIFHTKFLHSFLDNSRCLFCNPVLHWRSTNRGSARYSLFEMILSKHTPLFNS